MTNCPTLSTGGAFVSTLLRHIDCQGQTIGTVGYQALASPGSPFSLMLTALLTIFIALFGLRMVLGETPSVRDGVWAILKIGIVLLVATSWPAYRTVVYDVIVQGPAQLSAAVGGPSGLPGTNGDLISRLQISDDAITRLTTLGSGRNDLTSTPAHNEDGLSQPVERAPIADDLAFGSARILFLSSIVGAFAIVRLGAGILLALAPVFAGLLLFDIARGLFVGWARALLFTMLASVAVTLILGVQLALLEPWLTQALELRQARIVTTEAPIELLVLCLGFALGLAGAVGIILRLAFTLHLSLGSRLISETGPLLGQPSPSLAAREGKREPVRSERALAVANAVSAAQRREAVLIAAPSRSLPVALPAGGDARGLAEMSTVLSQSPIRRRRHSRKSAASALRDRRP